jgi:hypothetical protein
MAGPKEQAAEREAQANLKLIAAAEKVFRMEMGNYIVCNNTGEVNNLLRLMLSTSDTNWKYKVDNVGASTFRADASRNLAGSTKVFCINETQDSPVNTTCAAHW